MWPQLVVTCSGTWGSLTSFCSSLLACKMGVAAPASWAVTFVNQTHSRHSSGTDFHALPSHP